MKILIKPIKALTKEEMVLMNQIREKHFGKKARKNYKKDYLPAAKFFFVKEKNQIAAFGTLRDVEVDYLNKKYQILGICNINSVIEGRGYGKKVIQEMIKYLKKKGKTGLGFCGRQNMKFYEKAGLKTQKLFGKRFALRNPKTGEIRFEAKGDVGDGLFFEGKDKLISKVLSTKSTGYYYLADVKNPHW